MNLLETVLFLDPQCAPEFPCPRCGGACYAPVYHCLRCERREPCPLPN